MRTSVLVTLMVAATLAVAVAARRSEIKKMPGHTREEDVRSPVPWEYMDLDALPTSFDCEPAVPAVALAVCLIVSVTHVVWLHVRSRPLVR